VGYFHVVFTVSPAIGELAWQNKQLLYDLLFHASADTLREIAADPKHLGAEIGFLTVLHTWGQNLLHHPHVHCVVPAGGLSPNHTRWIACPEHFFLPVRVLSRVFRGKFLRQVREAYDRGDLSFHGNLAQHQTPAAFRQWLAKLYAIDWVVYAKPPFGGPDQVLKYLARYTHRVAISNDRLVSMDGDQIRFRWKDYARGQHSRTMTLQATEFIRRFLLHVLPRGFVRIRYSGFMANCHREAKLKLCRSLLNAASPANEPPSADQSSRFELCLDEGKPKPSCPNCGCTVLLIVETHPRPTKYQLLRSTPFDTS
jgi:hypothetical protein